MILPRVIPTLLLKHTGLVKTTRFKNPVYIGDARNAVKIFNEREVDEIILVDIQSSYANTPIQYDLIREIVSEAFMPLGYGGHVTSVEEARQLIRLGIEKIILCSAAAENSQVVNELSCFAGSSSTVVCIDYKKNIWGKQEVYTRGGRQRTGKDPITFAREMEKRGAGELVLNAIEREGSMQGYDLETIRAVSAQANIPVIASGGAGSLEDFRQAILAGASAVSAGSMFVFHGKRRGILINYPRRAEIRAALGKGEK